MWKWLLRPAWSPGARIALIFGSVLAMFVWAQFSTGILVEVLGQGAYKGTRDVFAPGTSWTSSPVGLFLMLALALLAEEAFRLTPLALVIWLARRKRPHDAGEDPVMLASGVTAALFGIAHLSNGLPLVHVLVVQGVLGFALNLVYMKAGGLHGRKIAGFTAAFTAHYVYDIAVLTFSVV